MKLRIPVYGLATNGLDHTPENIVQVCIHKEKRRYLSAILPQQEVTSTYFMQLSTQAQSKSATPYMISSRWGGVGPVRSIGSYYWLQDSSERQKTEKEHDNGCCNEKNGRTVAEQF